MICNTNLLFCLFSVLICLVVSCEEASNPTSNNKAASINIAPSTLQLFEQLLPSQTGIDFNNLIQENLKINYMRYDGVYQGAGVAVGDINNDGLADIYFTGNMVPDRLYLNKGNMKFEDITTKAGIVDDPQDWSTGVSFADVNNDGFLDIYVCKFLLEDYLVRQNHLYINNGNQTFTEKAEAFGVGDFGYSIQANFFDYDKDGWLDLYVANQPPNASALKKQLKNKADFRFTDRLYKNNGNNTFTDVSHLAGVINYTYSLSATVSDMNKDGWPDIYVACDYEEPDHFFQNNGDGTFTNISHIALRHMSNFSMGADIVDINNDGWFDIYTADMVAADNIRLKTNMSGMNPKKFWALAKAGYHYQFMFNALQLNNGNGLYSEIAQLSGISNTDWSWSAIFADFDNDGFQDLHVTNGQLRDVRNNDYQKKRKDYVEQKQKEGVKAFNPLDILALAPSVKISNYLYKNNGDLTFSNVTEQWGHGQKTFSQGSAYADLDNDGDLDIIINNTNDPAGIYANQTSDKKINNYLRVLLTGQGNNGKAFNTHVKIEYGDGLQQNRELSPVRGYMSASEAAIHFGLGKHTVISTITVTWPDGRQTVLNDIKTNQVLHLNQKDATGQGNLNQSKPTLFADISSQSGIHFKHTENEYDDYAKEILLPYKMSHLGPCLAKADVNGDGQDDFYIGGPIGQTGGLFIQQGNGKFQQHTVTAFNADKNSEDTGALFFDADGDKDADLYVVSGGNELKINATQYQDRLYINDGKGNFSKAKGKLPMIKSSGSKIAAGDFDNDGDVDLFVGGRQVPGKYGLLPDSYLLQNNGGSFKDVTDEIAEGLRKTGMVTSAVWMDYDGDKDLDLLIAGEWMPLTCYNNDNGKLTNVTEEVGFKDSHGWWNNIVAADMDQDGDPDLIAGNLGLNIKYKASKEHPFSLYVKDFDQNGTHDVYLGYYENGVCYPVRGRECSSQQLPFIKKEFENYDKFAHASLDEVLGSRKEGAEFRTANMFESCYIENKGNGKFAFHPLPNEAQISPIFGIAPKDWNNDGHLDLLVAGNFYEREVETTRSDAGIGQLLLGNGKGQFKPVPGDETGLKIYRDVRAIEVLNSNQGYPILLVANNNDQMQVYRSNQTVQ